MAAVATQKLGIISVLVILVSCGEAAGPWYDTEPAEDLSYLPLGSFTFEERSLAWSDADGPVDVDGYVPHTTAAPVAVFLPGANVIKERYRWLGATLASHGVAAFVVQPRALFGTSREILGTLDAVASDPGLSASVDLSRVLLGGHSAGGVAPVGLTDVAGCSPGVCQPGDLPPAGLAGLLLLGYHNQTEPSTASAPMAAIEVPWLLLSGTRDGLATPEKVGLTFDRLEDRPIYSLLVDGMNHFQLTDYVDLDTDFRLPDDLEPTRGNQEARAIAAEYIARYVGRVLLGDRAVAEDLGAADDSLATVDYRLPVIEYPTGHQLSPVHAFARDFPILADIEDVVATAEFRGERYLLARDDQLGVQLLRLQADQTLVAVPFPDGVAHGFYGNRFVNGLFGALKVFNDELWVAASTGSQGGELGTATGAELWAYNGSTWRPVVSRVADDDPLVEIAALDGCGDNDGATAAAVRVNATLEPGAFAGAILDDIGSPDAGDKPVQLQVVDNDASSLTVQVIEYPGAPAFTKCDGLVPGRKLWLRQGTDESGFGDPWNKAIIALEVYGERLFVGIGLNLKDGASLWSTGDGEHFELVIPQSFYGRHATGGPISSSISDLYRSAITGEDVLYVASTGTEGYGARLLALTDDGVRYLIDDSVDSDDTGLDEAGVGGESHQISSMVEFGGRLWLSGQNFRGLELFSMEPDGRLTKHVGAGRPLGLGWGDDNQLAGELFVVDGQLWVLDAAFIQSPSQLDNSSAFVWRTEDGDHWQLVSAHSFGINAVRASQLFFAGDRMYAITSGAALATPRSFRPLRVYTLTDRRN